jgi:glycosyltransferase involved in cell wall biosynthesis
LPSNDTSACSVSFEQQEILTDQGGEFRLRFTGDLAHGDVFLTIDIYDLDNPIRPDGHVGRWRFPVEAFGERCTGHIQLRPDGYDVSIGDVASEDRWINGASLHPRRAIAHAVLRTKSAGNIAAIDQTPLFASAQDLAEFRASFKRDWSIPRFAPPHFVPPLRTKIRIISQDIRLHDAVGMLCLDLYRMLRQNDVPAAMYAAHFDLEINDIVNPISRLPLDVGKDDTVIYFFSIFDRNLKAVLNLHVARKVGYFHGITPPKLLQVFDPESSVECRKAFGQLPDLARFDLLAANSAATAQDFSQGLADAGRSAEDVAIIPPCLMSKRTYPQTTRPVGSAKARLLSVGRLKANKRIEHMLELFAAYRSLCPDAECWIVGAATNTAYRDYLTWMEQKQLSLPPGAVHWLGQVSDERLQEIYRSASIYISMSEHEGFCLPVLEAMAAELPVVSFAQPAIQELLGGSGITFFEKDFGCLAAYLRTLLDAQDRLAPIVARQCERAGVVMREADGGAFWRLLEPALNRRPQRSSNTSIDDVITDQLP